MKVARLFEYVGVLQPSIGGLVPTLSLMTFVLRCESTVGFADLKSRLKSRSLGFPAFAACALAMIAY